MNISFNFDLIINLDRIITIIVIIFLIFYAFRAIRRLARTSATYNRRLLPFAYYSLVSWIVWLFALILVLSDRNGSWFETYFGTRIYRYTTVWLNIVQLCLMFTSIVILYSRKPHRTAVSISAVYTFSLTSAVVIFFGNFEILARYSYWYYLASSFVWAIMFIAFVPQILRLRLGWRYAFPFLAYGLAQLFFISGIGIIQELIVFFVLPIVRVVILFTWARLIERILKRAQESQLKAINKTTSLNHITGLNTIIEVMISSTVSDLEQERDSADRAIRNLHLHRFRAESYGSLAYTPKLVCEQMARNCDLFILIIGSRYGYITEPEHISVVEHEYKTAKQADPNKILVYIKKTSKREKRLLTFLKELEHFEYGYFRTQFATPEELYERIQIDVARWLSNRARKSSQNDFQPNNKMHRI